MFNTPLFSNQQIIQDIETHVTQNGGTYSEWYIGITADPQQRLFTEHNVDREKDVWIYRRATSSSNARSIEDYFLKQRNTDGGSGGGDNTTDCVYAFRKNSHTRR